MSKLIRTTCTITESIDIKSHITSKINDEMAFDSLMFDNMMYTPDNNSPVNVYSSLFIQLVDGR